MNARSLRQDALQAGNQRQTARRTQLTSTCSLSLLLAAGLAASPAAPAADPSDDEADMFVLEEVIVTGSRIRRTELSDAPAPMVTVDAEEIADRQFVNLIDAIAEIQVGEVLTNQGANDQFGDNFAFVDLLSLGSQRTLTLLNGRRVVPSNMGTVFVPGNASGAQVDLSIINPLAVERVEVVSGTGGAVYGADAVAGVVNIITRQDFEGFNVDVSGSLTENSGKGGGRLSAIWGTNLLDRRLNLMVAGEYSRSQLIRASNLNPQSYMGSAITNPDNGAVRNPAYTPAAAAAALAAGEAPPPVFLPATADGMRSSIYGPLDLRSPLYNESGVLMTGPLLKDAISTTAFIPSTVAGVPAGFGAAADPQGFAFFAPGALTTAQLADPAAIIAALGAGVDTTGLTVAQQGTLALQLLQANRPTPREYALQNSLDPLLFTAAFGGEGTYPRIANPDAATAALFPRLSVPLQFDSSGNLVPFNIGNLAPSAPAYVGSVFGGDGFDSYGLGYRQVRSGTERATFTAQHTFHLNDRVRWSGEYLYTDMTFSSPMFSGSWINSPTGAATAGNRSVPVYVDQNPFLGAQARNTIDALAAQGLAVPTLDGERVLYLGRAVTDFYDGGPLERNKVKTWRIAQSLNGDFAVWGRPFYWDVAAAYGEAKATNVSPDILDIEFALATDVVQGPDGPVCRQQTLAAPEPINLRDPELASINTLLPLTPTAAQVAACQPLNLFGRGAASQAAIDYVTVDGGTTNKNKQEYYAASLGSELFELPGGPLGVVIQAERRIESIAFMPGAASAVGAARNTTILANTGELEFTEYGAEVRVPLFGRDFSFPGMQMLELEGAVRRVDRSQTTRSEFYPDPGPSVEDDVYSLGLRWMPLDDLVLRGNISTSVRSASLVELFSAPSSGFGAANNPCSISRITLGPNPDVRRANCLAAVQMLGIAANEADAAAFLNTLINSTSSRPAAATGNPFLQNEKADAWSVGLTWKPSYVPGLQVGVDYVELELEQEIALYAPDDYLQNCFDSPAFPDTLVGGTPVCDLATLGVAEGSGFVIPDVNPITGAPVAGGAVPGQSATVQGPFQWAFYQYPNFNLGRREARVLNIDTRYQFPLDQMFGDRAATWGSLGLRASAFYTRQLDLYADGETHTDQVAGSRNVPKWRTRAEVSHRIGGLSNTVQWFWRQKTVDDPFQDPGQYGELSPAFVNSAYSYLNYSGSYALRDDVTVRLTVNNLTDARGPNGPFGDAFDLGVGREFILGVSLRF